MAMVDVTPLSTLITIFAAVPLTIVICIYGGEGASALLHRHWRSRRP